MAAALNMVAPAAIVGLNALTTDWVREVLRFAAFEREEGASGKVDADSARVLRRAAEALTAVHVELLGSAAASAATQPSRAFVGSGVATVRVELRYGEGGGGAKGAATNEQQWKGLPEAFIAKLSTTTLLTARRASVFHAAAAQGASAPEAEAEQLEETADTAAAACAVAELAQQQLARECSFFATAAPLLARELPTALEATRA